MTNTGLKYVVAPQEVIKDCVLWMAKKFVEKTVIFTSITWFLKSHRTIKYLAYTGVIYFLTLEHNFLNLKITTDRSVGKFALARHLIHSGHQFTY